MSQAFRSFAIVPAAGRSLRMGEPKLLLPWKQQSVIQCVLAAWKSSSVSHVVVVAHPEDVELAAVSRNAGAEVVIPALPPPQMKDSVRLGLEHVTRQYIPTARDAWLLAPADNPRLSAMVIDKLLMTHDPSDPRVLIPVQGGKRGHPVLFSWTFAAEVAGLAANEGLNQISKQHGWTAVEVSDEAIHCDLDTPEDYEKWKKERSN